VPAEVHSVAFSADELRQVSGSVGAGNDPILGALGFQGSYVDLEQNSVLVTVDEVTFQLLGGPLFVGSHPAIRLEIGEVPVMAPDLCTSGDSCGAPLRGGVILRQVNDATRNCSLGYTSSATDGSRWAITAGHCGDLNSVWRHGEVQIGPIRAKFDEAEFDVARIRIDSAYWLQAGGGYLYDYYSPNVPADLTYSIRNRTTIQANDVVCLNAKHSTPSHTCGLITRTYGYSGMPQTDFDACGGDSGGAWIFRTSGGSRWAYGVHSGSSPETCHAVSGYSIFTSVPDMNLIFDETAAATIRIEVRP
jgi:hypothetical protein